MRKFSIILSLALLLAGCDRQQEIDHSGDYNEVRSVNKVVFAAMAITKTARSERTAWYKVGKRIAVYSYDIYLQAYVDLGELKPDDLYFDDGARTVHVTLPPVKVEIAGRDMELKREYENIGMMRSDLDSKERAEMIEKANESFRSEIMQNPEFYSKLLETARTKARSYVEGLFADKGYTATVDFSSSAETPLRPNFISAKEVSK